MLSLILHNISDDNDKGEGGWCGSDGNAKCIDHVLLSKHSKKAL